MEAMTPAHLLDCARQAEDIELARQAIHLQLAVHGHDGLREFLQGYFGNEMFFAVMDDAAAVHSLRLWNADCMQIAAEMLGCWGSTWMRSVDVFRGWVKGQRPHEERRAAHRAAWTYHERGQREHSETWLAGAVAQLCACELHDFKYLDEDGIGAPYICAWTARDRHNPDHDGMPQQMMERFHARMLDAYLLPALGLEVTP